ncbi:MAG: hypothetical protein OXU98_03175, partial [Gammaproteobacteria bacterium]|nr:hypothetical protein [Gammaproteobacteria bacterium]
TSSALQMVGVSTFASAANNSASVLLFIDGERNSPDFPARFERNLTDLYHAAAEKFDQVARPEMMAGK